MSTTRRKQIIIRLRAEGRAAYEAGKSADSNPYARDKDMNTFQWYRGWSDAQEENESKSMPKEI